MYVYLSQKHMNRLRLKKTFFFTISEVRIFVTEIYEIEQDNFIFIMNIRCTYVLISI